MLVLWCHSARMHVRSLTLSSIPPFSSIPLTPFHLRAYTHKSPTITKSTASCFLSVYRGSIGATRVYTSFSFLSPTTYLCT